MRTSAPPALDRTRRPETLAHFGLCPMTPYCRIQWHRTPQTGDTHSALRYIGLVSAAYPATTSRLGAGGLNVLDALRAPAS